MGFYSLLILSLGIFVIVAIFSTFKLKTLKINFLFLLLLSMYVIGFFLIHHQIEETCEILISGNISEVLKIIQSWGYAAPVISILLMILQAVIAPLPAYLITAANGIIFGLFWGVVISSIGALAGALVSFSITRWFYKKYAVRLIKNSTTHDYIDKISSKHGFRVILIARLIPIISFDLISFAAGASSIKAPQFLLATFIGMLPATILYTVVANEIGAIDKLSNDFVMYSIFVVLILIVFWMLKGFVSKSISKLY